MRFLNHHFHRVAICALAILISSCGGEGTLKTDRSESTTPRIADTPTPQQMALREASPFLLDSAMSNLRYQLDAGPRVPNTQAHRAVGDWILQRMKAHTSQVEVQSWRHATVDGDTLSLRNIVARFGPSTGPRIAYLTHWDTRPVAEKDTDLSQRTKPIAGANDGAAGVAMFVEIARQLSLRPPAIGVDLIFVDGEDYGDFRDRSRQDVLIGSQYLSKHPPFGTPADYTWGVVWDLVGTRDGLFQQEPMSVQNAPNMVRGIWEIASALGYNRWFVSEIGKPVLDDHIPLQEKGWPVGVVIALNFPEHHTQQDVLEAVDPSMLKRVGDVALLRLYGTASSGPAIPGAK